MHKLRIVSVLLIPLALMLFVDLVNQNACKQRGEVTLLTGTKITCEVQDEE